MACREHGVVVASVPWARRDAGHTHAFDEQVAWLATQASKSTVTQLIRIAWRTVGSIITRVWADVDAQHGLDGLRRIGIDEISYKRGFKFLMVVVDLLAGPSLVVDVDLARGIVADQHDGEARDDAGLDAQKLQALGLLRADMTWQ